MKSVGSDEAKTHFPRLLDQVERGETITITKHGKPVAVLSPIERRGRYPSVAEIPGLITHRRR